MFHKKFIKKISRCDIKKALSLNKKLFRLIYKSPLNKKSDNKFKF